MKIHVQSFTFGPFQENTYLAYNEEKTAVIIDPGCSNSYEEQQLVDFIESNNLEIKALLSTHCHIDHIFGNAFILNKYKVDYYIHELDLPVLERGERSAQVYGIQGFTPSPQPTKFLKDNEVISFDNLNFKVIFGPGHAPGHVAFYSEENHFAISGDILFKGSFGRVDLPGGDLETLKQTIHNRFFTLPEQTIIYSGHGPETTVGFEKKTNYILQF
ncbi:MAG: MBL fold metallo-hydrolase [Crocinitomicaceae bacterium]|jgi:hydroxyacylglutathione hydrolase